MSRYGIVFMGFFAIVLLYWAISAVGTIASQSSFDFGAPLFSSGGSGGLSEIDFALFSSKIQKNYITQGYGRTAYAYMYPGGWHNGIDIAAQYGVPVHAATGGTVVATGNQDSYCPGRAFGRFVAIQDASSGSVLLYAHLGKIYPGVGDNITAGQAIATIGTSGLETGPHLHLTVYSANSFKMLRTGCGPSPEGEDINPIKFLDSLKTATG